MTTPRISVLIDTCNQEHFLAQAIESVLAQGLSPEELEILVVDDGSTDNTAALVAKFAPRVRYLFKNNGGQASAFNAAIPKLHGEFIAFLDADDWWAPSKLSHVLDVFEKDPSIGTVGHAYYRSYAEGHPDRDLTEIVAPDKSTCVTLASPSAARHADPLRIFFGTSRLAVRKQVLDRIPPIPDALVFSADAFIFSVAMALADAYVLAEPLCFYRQHADNLYSFRSAGFAKRRRVYEILKKLVEVLPPALANVNLSPEVVWAFLGNDILEARQLRLRYEGGWPWQTFHTELLCFRQAYEKYSFRYALYKYAVLTSTLLMPPAAFYSLRDQYTKHNLRRFRKLLGEPVPMASIEPRRVKAD